MCWFIKIGIVSEVGVGMHVCVLCACMHVCVCLNKFHSFYMVAVVSIIGRRVLSIDAHQPNKIIN